MKLKYIYCFASSFLFALASCQTETKNEENRSHTKPNIVYILADDLGYGDVGVNNPDSKIKSPNIDKLASEGMRFTDAHSPSSVCTPTRYGILTGRYCWRSKLPLGVLRGYGQALIDKDRVTVASLLKENGYTTGVIGKWHLGLDWVVKDEYKDSINSSSVQMNEVGMVKQMNDNWIDFTQKPTDGPIDHGFDYSYILPASLDMQPYCYLENDKLLSIPDGYTPGNDLNTGYYGAFWREGRISPDFKFDEVLPNFTRKAEEFIKNQSKSGKPFFMYLALAAPHTPWVPQDQYKNKSKAGQYGDFVQMVDATIGNITQALKENGLEENTIVIFTSDNGPFWREDKVEEYDHKAAHHFRGMKADIHDGGHRIPFIVRWPGKVEAGSQSNLTTTLTNLIATCADIIGSELDNNTGEDSQSIYSELVGEKQNVKEAIPVIHHSSRGFFAIRKGQWKLIEKRGSGGFTAPQIVEPKDGEPIGQLYNMAEDPSETKNLYNEKPDLVKELLTELNAIREK